jgi:cysteinyl-tRNA synthetase
LLSIKRPSKEELAMAIHIYNTLTGKKELFETIEPKKVRFYACGPTVYNLFHIGNARMFVVFDTIRRYLEYREYEVKYVQNFTDVDDKIIARANELGKNVRWVADHYIEAYFHDADALGIRRASVHPRVTETIDDIVAFIADLVRTGYAYAAGGDVYFHTSAFQDYGKLSHQSVDEMRAGFRIDVNEQKQDPSDFALWKAAKPGEEFWDSPWGPGRPGWHIECSVMNQKYLGKQIDIHGGGRDLVFPHHENEIAQSEAHSGESFARYWVHNGTLNINGEKMSKSLGNFIMTRDLLARRPARVIRYFLLSAQYRHPLNYTEEGMDQAEQSLDRINRCLRNLAHRKAAILELPADLRETGEMSQVEEQAIQSVRAQFVRAMDDDFNTADAIAGIFEGVRAANTYLTDARATIRGIEAWETLLNELLNVLGLKQSLSDELVDDDVVKLLEARNEARKRRDFQRADELRDELERNGIVLEDTPQGTRWHRR